MKKNVLVFPCGSEIGLEIHRSLQFSSYFTLVGASSVEDHGRFVYGNYVGKVPFVDSAGFIDAINQVVAEQKIDFIFPAHDSAVLSLAQSQSELNATVVTSPAETCLIARSKRATYARLQDVVRVPRQYSHSDSFSYPVFVKPDVGQGSKGAFLAETESSLRSALERDQELVITEYLPGDEFTVDCFTNMNGELLFAQARSRSRVMNGISVNSTTVDGTEFMNFAQKINAALRWRGVWFFQVKRGADGELALLEIAPRVAGTMAVSRMKGVNLPMLALFDQMGIDVSIRPNKFDVEIDRALAARFKVSIEFSTVYVDFDDTIILGEKVNAQLVGFLYACLNQGKRIILITRHRSKIDETLKRYRISPDIFDKIITLTDEDFKSTHMTQDAIFIDDSFAERRTVLEQLGVPVFDVSEAIELL